jgi:hypothetical protein
MRPSGVCALKRLDETPRNWTAPTPLRLRKVLTQSTLQGLKGVIPQSRMGACLLAGMVQ